MTAIPRKLALSLAIILTIGALSVGAYFRLHRLDHTDVWDADVAAYSIYADKYHQIMNVAMSERFTKLISARKASGRFQNIEAVIKDMVRSDEWKNITPGIRQTDPLPSWFGKMLFIMSVAVFRNFYDCNKAILFFTALVGILVTIVAALIGMWMSRDFWPAAAVAVLVAISPMLAGYSRVGFANIAAAFFVLPAIACLAASVRREGSVLLVVSGALIGVGALYHPSIILWFPMAIMYEALTGGWQFRRSIGRIFHLGIGFIIPLLIGEILYLDAWVISLLFGGQPYRPFFYSMFLHDIYREPAVPLFYTEAIFRYEGPFFLLAFALSTYWSIRRRKDNPELFTWAFFGIIPFILFSVFTHRFPPVLRNLVPMMAPAYISIVASAVDAWSFVPLGRRRGTVLVIALILCVHGVMAIRTDIGNGSVDVRGNEIISYVRQSGTHVAVPENGGYFLSNLLGVPVDKTATSGRNMYFYRGLDIGSPEGMDEKVFHINVYDLPMFYLENPVDLSIHDDQKRLSTANLLYFTDHPRKGP